MRPFGLVDLAQCPRVKRDRGLAGIHVRYVQTVVKRSQPFITEDSMMLLRRDQLHLPHSGYEIEIVVIGARQFQQRESFEN